MGENAEKAVQRSHVINKIAMIASGAGLVVLENIFFFVAPPLPLPCVVRWLASALEMKMNDVRKAPGNGAGMRTVLRRLRTFFDARRAITNEKESSQRTQRTKLNSYTLTFDVAIFV